MKSTNPFSLLLLLPAGCIDPPAPEVRDSTAPVAQASPGAPSQRWAATLAPTPAEPAWLKGKLWPVDLRPQLHAVINLPAGGRVAWANSAGLEVYFGPSELLLFVAALDRDLSELKELKQEEGAKVLVDTADSLVLDVGDGRFMVHRTARIGGRPFLLWTVKARETKEEAMRLLEIAKSFRGNSVASRLSLGVVTGGVTIAHH